MEFSSPLAAQTPGSAAKFWLASHRNGEAVASETTALQDARSRLNVCERKGLDACIADWLARRRKLVRDHGLDAPTAPAADQQVGADQRLEGAAADLNYPDSTLISARELAMEAVKGVQAGLMGPQDHSEKVPGRIIMLTIVSLPVPLTGAADSDCTEMLAVDSSMNPVMVRLCELSPIATTIAVRLASYDLHRVRGSGSARGCTAPA